MIYKGVNGYTISSRKVWLPGFYDSERTAQYAFKFPNEVLQRLSDRICRTDGQNRAITLEDLQIEAKFGKHAAPRRDLRRG